MYSTMDIKSLQRELKDKSQILACAKEFNLVGDPTKLKICYLLCHHPELSVNEIAAATETSVSNTSHALRKLRSLGIVSNRRKSRQAFYSLAQPKIARAINSYLGGP